MSTFAVDVSTSDADIIGALNYALSNLGYGATSGLAANVLVANITSGEITTTSSNSGGYTSTTVVSYLYRYMDVKYANTSTGGSGFTSNSTLSQYYGLRNTANTTISNNPSDYVWYQVSGGFGTTKSLWYATIGGRQLATFAGTAAPQVNYVSVPDNTPLDLDAITAAAGNQVVITNAYLRANTQPITPTGGFYDFATFTLYPPTTPDIWSASVPAGSDPVYTTQASFSGQATSNVAPQTAWAYPNILSSNFGGNTGPAGSRGPIPMAYVLTSSDPTSYSDYDYTTAFAASRSNIATPIGVGYTPITGDTSQFLYANLISTNNSITVVKTFDSNTFPQWTTVRGNVISGNLFVTGTITSSALNTNDIYVINTQSTNATIGNVASNGYWLQANTGSARFGGDVSIGANLNVAGLITLGGLNAGTVGPGVIQANVITGNLIQANTIQGSSIVAGSITATEISANLLVVGNIVSIGSTLDDPNAPGYWLNNTTGNVRFGGNTSIGDNLIVGQNALIGGNLTINGLLTNGSLVPNVVGTTNLIQDAVNQTVTAVNNTGSNLLNFTEGAIAYPLPYSYWPAGTRGFAIQANLTPQSNSSTIIVNFSTYINSTANAASNLVEVWRSGNSNIALTTFNNIRYIWKANTVVATTPFMAVGSQGQGVVSYDGGTTWANVITNAGTSNFNSVAGGQNSSNNYKTIAFYPRANTGAYYSGNLTLANAASNLGNSILGDISSSAIMQVTGNTTVSGNCIPALISVNNVTVGNVFLYDLQTNTVNKMFSNSPFSGNMVNAVGTNIYPSGATYWHSGTGPLDPSSGQYNITGVAVGSNKQISYSKFVSTTTLPTYTWTTCTVNSPSGGIPNPNFYAVANNATNTLQANTWVTVGSVYSQTSPSPQSHSGIWYSSVGSNNIPSTWSEASVSPSIQANVTYADVTYGNGYFVAILPQGNIAYSSNGSSWTFVANTPATQLNRGMTSIAYDPVNNKFAAIGNSFVMTATTSNLAAWTGSNISVRATGLTRLAYYGSWYDPGRVDIPLATQQLTNGTVVSGTAIDTTVHSTTDTITYYVVAGNMAKLLANANNFVYTANPTITVTEQKR